MQREQQVELYRVSDDIFMSFGFNFETSDDCVVPEHFKDNCELLDFMVLYAPSQSNYMN
jgi:hypothetical protein